MKKRLLSEDNLKQIESHIKACESRFSGQLVVVSALKSDLYTALPLELGGIGLLLATFVHTVRPHDDHFFLWQCGGAALFALFGRLPVSIRYLVPPKLQEARVWKAALASFVERGVYSTRHQNGILIYLSETERRVQIIADTLAFKTLPKETWAKEAKEISRGVRDGNPVEAICQTLDSLTAQLEKHFPKSTDDSNELSDEVRLE